MRRGATSRPSHSTHSTGAPATGAVYGAGTGALGQGFFRILRTQRFGDGLEGWSGVHGRTLADGRIRLRGPVAGEAPWEVAGWGVDFMGNWGLRSDADC